MKGILILLCTSALFVGCNRNRVGDPRGVVEWEARELSTIKTGTSVEDARTAGSGTAIGASAETSGGSFATRGIPVSGSTSANLPQPNKAQPDKG